MTRGGVLVESPKLKQHIAVAPPPPANDGNAIRTSNVIYELLKEYIGVGIGGAAIHSVRTPAGKDNAIAILFEDGRDVIIRFEEVSL
jgi:hypothetical protein